MQVLKKKALDNSEPGLGEDSQGERSVRWDVREAGPRGLGLAGPGEEEENSAGLRD